jgi:tetratricopeptide (TPR) repeat protein
MNATRTTYRLNRSRTQRTLTALLFWFFALTANALADSLDERYLAGLRERRLFELAERFCLDNIAEESLDAQRRAVLASELARTYAEHAVQTPPAARAALWDKAHQVVGDYRQAFPSDGRLVVVELQDALTWLARGELARQEAEVAVGRVERIDDAKRTLREAIRRLRAAGEIVAVLQRRRRPGDPVDEREPTTAQLHALDRSIRYQLARAYRNQALCYPEQSADRINSLTQALEQLGPLADLPVADDLIWRARAERVVCYRLLGDVGRATHYLAALVEGGPPPSYALRAQAEKIRLLLDRKLLPQALAETDKGRTLSGVAAAELDYAHLEAHVAAWRAAAGAKDSDAEARWQRKAAAQVRLIEQQHGPYWMRRAETLLAGNMAGSTTTELPALIRAAESYYRARQIDEALAAYDRAYELALDKAQGEQAFDAAFTAATIEHDRNRHAAALARYRRLALALPKHPRAGGAHLLAVLNAAAQIRAAEPADRSALTDAYLALLEEHLAAWPGEASAAQAAWWLGRLHESQARWEPAVAAYRRIAADHELFADAVAAAGRCWGRQLAALEAAGQPTAGVAKEAIEYFEGIVLGPDRRWPQQWTAVARAAAVSAARLRLHYTDQGFKPAEQLLSAALNTADDADDAWKSDARSLLVFSLAGQGRSQAATTVMDQISAGSSEQLLDMLAALAPLVDEAQGKLRSELAELQLRAAALLAPHRAKLSPDQIETWRTVRAAALAAAGRTDEALTAYTELAEAYPNSGRVQEARAALLAATGDPAALRTALAKWHEVEKRSRRSSDRWFRARFALAETYHRLGENDKAAKLIKLTAVLHPELGGPEMKSQFQKLLAECGR